MFRLCLLPKGRCLFASESTFFWRHKLFMDQELGLAPHPHHLGPPRCSAGGGARAVWHLPSRLWLSHCSTGFSKLETELHFRALSGHITAPSCSANSHRLQITTAHYFVRLIVKGFYMDCEGRLIITWRSVIIVFFRLKIVDTKVRQTLTPPPALSGHRVPPRGLPWSGLGRREQPRGAAGGAGGASSST